MTKKIVAIGGGENGRYLGNGKYREYETEPMDKEIIRWCNLYHGNKSTVNPNNSEVVEKAVYALINKQMKFLTNHYV